MLIAQAAETGGWDAGQWIALTAVLVTGVGAVFTVAVNAWRGNRRLASEERRHKERLASDEAMHEARLKHEAGVHTERLAFERREAVRSTAAEAYGKASDVLYRVNTSTIIRIAEASELVLPDEINQSKIEAQQALSLVRTLGWTKNVQDRALMLNLELMKFLNQTVAFAAATKGKSPHMSTAAQEWDALKKAAQQALELYRMEITK